MNCKEIRFDSYEAETTVLSLNFTFKYLSHLYFTLLWQPYNPSMKHRYSECEKYLLAQKLGQYKTLERHYSEKASVRCSDCDAYSIGTNVYEVIQGRGGQLYFTLKQFTV